MGRYVLPDPSSYCSPMASGAYAAIPADKNPAAFSFCQTSRSSRMTMPTFVSFIFRSPDDTPRRRVRSCPELSPRRPDPESQDDEGAARARQVVAHHQPGVDDLLGGGQPAAPLDVRLE